MDTLNRTTPSLLLLTLATAVGCAEPSDADFDEQAWRSDLVDEIEGTPDCGCPTCTDWTINGDIVEFHVESVIGNEYFKSAETGTLLLGVDQGIVHFRFEMSDFGKASLAAPVTPRFALAFSMRDGSIQYDGTKAMPLPLTDAEPAMIEDLVWFANKRRLAKIRVHRENNTSDELLLSYCAPPPQE